MTTLSPDPLINHGFVRLNDAPVNDSATVIVVGLPRSGTSMVASVLKTLGVFIGKQVDNAVFEDHEFAAALEPDKADRLPALIAARNAQHHIWGFKRPEAYKQLPKLCAACRNPRVIVTFRDILAISLRNTISMQLDPVKFLPNLAAEYQALAATIKRSTVPCLLISYEKALQFPDKAVIEIAGFCGINPAEDKLSEAIAIIENGNPQYIQSARLQYQGFVGKLVDGRLRGWVKVRTRDQTRVNVALELDGNVVQTTRAELYRPDVQQAGYGDGRYGFEFTVPDAANRDSIVNVRVQNSTILVKNSGMPLSKY
jgi:hypothetical protein